MTAWVLTPCHRGRLEELKTMIDSLSYPSSHIVVVTTLPDPIQAEDLEDFAFGLPLFEKPGMLFGEWLNMGLDFIAKHEEAEHYDVLCVGSSLVGRMWSVLAMSNALNLHPEASMVGQDFVSGVRDRPYFQLPGRRTVHDRVPGMCFMIRGELGLRLDPQFRWWYSDDDFEMQHRTVGEVGLVDAGFTYPGEHVLNEEQERHAIEDRAKFVAKWGVEPW